MEQAIQECFAVIAPLIGRTPLLEIAFSFRDKPRKLYAKTEYYNLTGLRVVQN